MPLIVKDTAGDYTPPPQGLFPAVCVDVVDLGLVETQFGKKYQVRFIFQMWSEDGTQKFQPHKTYNASLNAKSVLYKDLMSWFGRKLTSEEVSGGLDLERLIGKNCQIQIIHDPGDDGKIWANIKGILPPARGIEPLVPVDYQRHEKYARMKEEQKALENQGKTPF